VRTGYPTQIYSSLDRCSASLGGIRSPSLPHNSNIPTFEIINEVNNKQVTIQTSSFPPHTTFVVNMDYDGAKGINGIEVDSTYSANGGTFKVSYIIPKALRGQDRIAIRLQSSSGYYSHSWFFNNSAGWFSIFMPYKFCSHYRSRFSNTRTNYFVSVKGS